MFAAGLEFFILVHLDVELCAVVIRREDLTFATDQQAAGAGDIVHHLFDVLGDFFIRFPAAIVPVEGHRSVFLAGREFKFQAGLVRIGLLVAGIRLFLAVSDVHQFLSDNAGRITEFQSAERHIAGMASHIAQSACTKVEPAAPVERQITFAVFADRCGS